METRGDTCRLEAKYIEIAESTRTFPLRFSLSLLSLSLVFSIPLPCFYVASHFASLVFCSWPGVRVLCRDSNFFSGRGPSVIGAATPGVEQPGVRVDSERPRGSPSKILINSDLRPCCSPLFFLFRARRARKFKLTIFLAQGALHQSENVLNCCSISFHFRITQFLTIIPWIILNNILRRLSFVLVFIDSIHLRTIFANFKTLLTIKSLHITLLLLTS